MASIPACHAGDQGSIPLVYFPVLVEHAIYYITSESSRIYKLTTCSKQGICGSIVVNIPACYAGRPGFDSLPGSSIYFPVLVEDAIHYITSESSRIYKRTTGTDHEILGSIVVSIPACHAGDQGSIPCREFNLSSCISRARRLLQYFRIIKSL